MIVGFVALVWGADRFVIGAAATARNLGVSPLIVGLTIVAFGTSAPEMLVSAVAASQDNSAMGVGNALGSNITNLGLVLGVAALVQPLDVHSKIVRRELPLLLFIMTVAAILTYDGHLGRFDGTVLLIGMGMMIGWTVRQGLAERAGSEPDALREEFEAEVPATMKTSRALFWFVAGGMVLLAAAWVLVWGAGTFARLVGVSELVIGLSVIAFGTSLPELAASVAAAIKREHDIAVGNVIGSNMFNLLAVLALPGAINPVAIDAGLLQRDWPVMFGMTFLVLAVAWMFRRRLGRPAAALLVASYIGYVTWLFAVERGAEVSL